MLLERYLAEVLTKQFGHLVEDFNDSVRVSIWRGELVLNNVVLKRTALQESSTSPGGQIPPLELAHGRIGKLHVRIPWPRVRDVLLRRRRRQQQQPSSSEAKEGSRRGKKGAGGGECTVVLSDVHILITPQRRRRRPSDSGGDGSGAEESGRGGDQPTDYEDFGDGEYDGLSNDQQSSQQQQQQQQQRLVDKEKEIQAALDAELLHRVAASSSSSESSEDEPSKSSWWASFFRSQLQALWSDLVVKVQNVHVRYEDPGTSMGFVWHTNDDGAVPSSSSSSHQPQRAVVRYRPPFAIGFTLEQFTLLTIAPDGSAAGATSGNSNATSTNASDSGGKKEKGGGGEDSEEEEGIYRLRRKVAATENLAAYWDSDCRLLLAERAEQNGSESAEGVYEFYRSAFCSWQNDAQSSTRHSFLLDPFSPSIEITMVDETTSEEAGRSSSDQQDQSETSSSPQQQPTGARNAPRGQPAVPVPPPSSVQFCLPACHLSISRSMLQDLGYLRQSLKTSQQSTVLPEATVRRLARLRPQTSPQQDPRGWWKYAGEAVLVLQSIRHENDSFAADRHQSESSPTRRSSKRQYRGWLALARALGRRKQYVNLYITFLGSANHAERISAHLALLELEKVLQVDEVVAFRIAAYSAQGETDTESATTPDQLDSMSCLSPNSGNSHRWQWLNTGQSSGVSDVTVEAFDFDEPVLSVEHRATMYAEMARALSRTKLNLELQQVEEEDETTSVPPPRTTWLEDNCVVWTTILACPELLLRVNDRPTSRHRHEVTMIPVTELTCAIMVDQRRFRDGSWEITNRIGSLKVKDCMSVSERDGVDQQGVPPIFPNLVGPKGGESCGEDKTFLLNGVAHHQSVHVSIRRSFTRERGTTTSTTVRVLPLEIVYSTAPVEALSRVLSIANLELADDYHRISSKLHDWRDRQKARLFEALAHKEKKIIVDIDVGAPVVLLPEDSCRDSSLLIIDFGRLQFSNDDRRDSDLTPFDDHWRLDLTNVQVQCSKTYAYRGIAFSQGEDGLRGILQQLIEPFCLDFAISTRIEKDDKAVETFQILASLPRLVFNVTTSAQRLLLRLRNQWEKRKVDLEQFLSNQVHRDSVISLMGQRRPLTPLQPPPTQKCMPDTGRVVVFRCVAPLLKFRFENDVDGRDCDLFTDGSFGGSTPLLDFSLRGIEGGLQSERSLSGHSQLSWDAKLRALDAIDLYQGAGDDYTFLLSSITPELWMGQNPVDLPSFDGPSTYMDLVTFSYQSGKQLGSETSSPDFSPTCDPGSSDKLMMKFNELYMEWNPETLAALHLAMNLPANQLQEGTNSPETEESFEEFYDAREDELDEFYDALSSLDSMSEQDLDLSLEADGSLDLIWPSNLQTHLSSIRADVLEQSPAVPQTNKPFEVTFELSKLRVHFNKETRHRRLLIAEMDQTSVLHIVKETGGSTTTATIGNLTFIDADSMQNKTLYREILGLKTDSESSPDRRSSLLEMELSCCPRSRKYFYGQLQCDNEEDGVLVDLSSKSMEGYDYSLKAHFSPMRFVYLQQLWFEIMDYFFEGIIGYEVWGNQRPVNAPSDDPGTDAPNADKVSFTRFDIVLDSPVILFPVSYCSTDFIRLEAASMAFSNHYNYAEMRYFGKDSAVTPRLTWFNNCDIVMDDLSILSCTGRSLSDEDKPFSATIALNWPTGPAAPLNVPKWKVNCNFEDLFMSLHQEDYAMLQHMVQQNLGEESRNLDEWHALQNLPPLVLERYKQDIMVHFGYDKKDVTPTTFDMTVSLPVLCFKLICNASEVALVECESVSWCYKKMTDHISRQRVACDLEIRDSSSASAQSLLSSQRLESPDQHHITSDLIYCSTTHPSGDNLKTLQINDPQIHLNYPVWEKFSSFFKGLPEPAFLSPNEVIQVGDRWYKIGSKNPIADPSSFSRLSWIASSESTGRTLEKSPSTSPIYKFELSMHQPSIVVGSSQSSLLVLADEVVYHHVGRASLVERDFKLQGIILQTRRLGKNTSKVPSLFKPWSVQGNVYRCNGVSQCKCQSHSVKVSADMLLASVTYFDFTTLIEIALQLMRDVKHSDGSDLDESSHSASVHLEDQVQAVDMSGLPKETTSSFEWDGFNLTLIDDSGRHFASCQDLVVLSLGKIDLICKEATDVMQDSGGWGQHSDLTPAGTYTMCLRLSYLEIMDCLQSSTSPFHKVAAVRAAYAVLPENLCSSVQDRDNQVAVEVSSKVTKSRKYEVKVGSIDAQYNPSLVIALQRFLGRLSKDVKLRLDTLFDDQAGELDASASQDHVHEEKDVLVSLSIDHLQVGLNKEHQGRQLLEAVLADCQVVLSQSQGGLLVTGHLGIFDAWKNKNCGVECNILKAGGEKEHFVDFQYITFSDRKILQDADCTCNLPEWVTAKLPSQNGEIDDFLQVSVAALELVYLKEMALELLDYLSNGMPGRGMGATSRAAQGFVNKRIQTKSFLQVHVEAPRVLIPQNELSESGIDCHLGDLSVESWVQADSLNSDCSMRMVNMVVSGLSARTYDVPDSEPEKAPLFSHINVSVDVEKRKSQLTIQSKVSAIEVVLRYSDFLSVLAVLHDNVGKKIERSNWENLEVAWEEEVSRDNAAMVDHHASPRYSKDVSYSEYARHVRYGQTKHSPDASGSPLEILLALDCERLSLLLHRDDDLVTKDGSDLGYAVVLLAMRQLDASVKRQEGIESLSVSLGEVFLFDIGERGRAKHREHSDKASKASPHSVLVEGYSTPGDGNHFDSQVVVNIDRAASLPDTVNVSILVNYLSAAALLRPLEEAASFFSCTWAVSGMMPTEDDSHGGQAIEGVGATVNEHSIEEGRQPKPSGSSLKLKFVLHYARLIFPANEVDRNSRALVLEGLAMLNATRSKGSKELDRSGQPPADEPSTLQVHADFQDIYSYINPDISSVISLDCKHMNILTRAVPDIRLAQPYEGQQEPDRLQKQKHQGIPLLLPLTIGIEFEQKIRNSAPTTRSLGVNVDCLSMMLSTEDAQLIDNVFKKWSRKHKDKKQARTYLFDIVFENERLGIGLRKEGNKVVVDHVGVAARQLSIERGDALHAINGVPIPKASRSTLSDMVDRLANEPRPLRVTFARKLAELDQVEDLQVNESESFLSPAEGSLCQGSHDSFDISVSSAVVTVMEKDVTLLRGHISSTDVGCKLSRTSTTVYRIDLSTKIEVEYYNLRIWAWEPLLEPGGIFLSAEFQDPHTGPKGLSIELGDRPGGPLCFNLTDAAVETFSKFQKWRRPSDQGLDGVFFADFGNGDVDDGLVSKKAANAALTFAQRQKKESAKPCVFRNKSGVSIAFAQQKTRNQGGLVRSGSFLFATVGDYHGLQGFRSSDVTVVSNGEEASFRVDVLPESQDAKRGRRFPPLTVSLQAVADAQVQPLTDLDITTPGEMAFPMTLVHMDDASVEDLSTPREWVSWLVEQMDERTVLTLGSSIRVVSMLEETAEIGVEVLEEGRANTGGIKSIGTCRSGVPLYLPLWLAMQGRRWRCFVRIASGYSFSPLFTAREDGSIDADGVRGSFVKCQSHRDPSLYLSVGVDEVRGITTLTLDCAIILRNLLPTRLEWELADNQAPRGAIIDGSSIRRARLNSNGSAAALESGERAEVFSKGYESLHLRFAVPEIPAWSNWVSLSLTKGIIGSGNDLSSEDTADAYVVNRRAKFMDEFGIPLPVSVRVAPKRKGIEAALYAELWFSNCTTLPLVFGCPQEHVTGPLDGYEVDSSSSELTAAEAALKEISSLFETGDDGKGFTRERHKAKPVGSADSVRIPAQTGRTVVEECFEYIEVENSTVKHRWWALENSRLKSDDMTLIEKDGKTWQWLDKSWFCDMTGITSEGWESTLDLEEYSVQRSCDPKHKYRRRRWFRGRSGASVAGHLPSICCFFQPIFRAAPKRENEKSQREEYLRVAMKVGGGKWALSLMIPRYGTVYGALRVAKERWPRVSASTKQPQASAMDNVVYELCYTVAPLDGDWAEVSRVMLVTPRFLLRNGSRKLVFEVKQSGSDDSTAVKIAPGETTPFHWASFRLPDLICVRPVVNCQRSPVYRWSGGFDPLTIGVAPLRIRKKEELPLFSTDTSSAQWRVNSIQAEADIRPRTGGTGINISFQEEDELGSGALFRIENNSCFPIWISQDGIIANLQLGDRCRADTIGDCVRPSESSVFALDVPFRQGKYAGRKAATMEELLRVRLALAPLSSRAGIETTKVISLTTAGERVRLNPSKLMLLNNRSRVALRRVRVLGFVVNDGPTRVLRFCNMAKSESESLFVNPFNEEIASPVPDVSIGCMPEVSSEIERAANQVEGIMSDVGLPVENVAVERAVFDVSQAYALDSNKSASSENEIQGERDLIISFRAAFQGFVFSLVDSAPTEICVISLKNINALASWNMLRTTASTVYFTITRVQVDNMLPNSPFPVAVNPMPLGPKKASETRDESGGEQDENNPPILVIGISFAPRHKSGTVCLRSVTIAPRNLAISVDLAFLVRLQTYVIDLYSHFEDQRTTELSGRWDAPDIDRLAKELDDAAGSGMGRQKIYLGGLTILPCNIKLSVAPARALTPAQASFEGEVAAAIHQAVRKGDVKLGDTSALLGVKLGHRNATPLAVVRGVFKSFVVDALLRLNGAQLNFAGVSLRNHISTSSQLATHLGAHYFTSLRHNLPSVVGSLALFGNPVGLVRGLGDGVSDFVLEPVKGFQRSVQEMDATHLVDGVARGTLSLARHTVGGFADSAALLAETFSKNMTVLTLDRRYAQKRDRKDALRGQESMNVAVGIGSGVQKLAQGFLEGVAGVVRAPLRGAEKRGFEGFAKGIGKGLLGLLVKPIIGISDGITDVMIGVKGSVEGSSGSRGSSPVQQIRPRRALYGTDRMVRPYNVADAAASALMMRSRLAGENYLSHLDMGNRVALLSAKRLLLLGSKGEEQLVLKFKHIESLSVREIDQEDGRKGWGIIVVLNTPRRNGSEVEVINCGDKVQADELCQLLEQGMKLVTSQQLRERMVGDSGDPSVSSSG